MVIAFSGNHEARDVDKSNVSFMHDKEDQIRQYL